MGWAASSERVGGAQDATAAAVEDVGVDHGCLDVRMAEELLDGADVVAALEQVGREGMAERVGRRGLGEAGQAHGDGEAPLHDRLVEVMPMADAGRAVGVMGRRGEDVLLAPFAVRVQVFLGQREGQRGATQAEGQVLFVPGADAAQMAAQILAA